jgi:isocitrate/methylisocitrate lyase
MAISDPIPTHAEDASRWEGVERPYDADAVEKLRGSLPVEHTLARHGAEKLWSLLHERDYVAALGASTGNQAVQQVRAGLEAIYLSGWQVAADANQARQMYPDQGLYPVNSVPEVVRGINAALQRADQIDHAEGKDDIDWFVPIVADGEAGFGGHLNVFELTKAMIAAGTAGVHFEDQLASEKKCGHMGGKVLLPTAWAIRNLVSARLAADVSGTPTLIVARTDADAADMVISDADERDHAFLTGERTEEGFFRSEAGIEQAIARGVAYAPYADLVWCETSEPDMEQAERFAKAIHDEHPGKLLAYNCSPSFNWKGKLDDDEIAGFQQQLGEMGYRFQFITLAGFHTLNHSMFELARGYREHGMTAYAELQEREFASEDDGFTAVQHQQEVGAGYFEEVAMAITGGESETTALSGSTEESQFQG